MFYLPWPILLKWSFIPTSFLNFIIGIVQNPFNPPKILKFMCVGDVSFLYDVCQFLVETLHIKTLYKWKNTKRNKSFERCYLYIMKTLTIFITLFTLKFIWNESVLRREVSTTSKIRYRCLWFQSSTLLFLKCPGIQISSPFLIHVLRGYRTI